MSADKCAFAVVAATSQIPNAGDGLFLRCSDGTATLPAGSRVAWYVGELLDAETYFALDAAGSLRVDYAHAVEGSEFAIAPELAKDGTTVLAVHEAARLSAGGDIVRSEPSQDAGAVAPCALGHYANDRFSVQPPSSWTENFEGDFATSIEAYRQRTCGSGGAFAEVRVDWTWRNESVALADVHATRNAESGPALVAFPMLLVEAVSSGPELRGPAGVEVFLSYGVNYWASRVISPLFWSQKSDDDRPLARRLHEVAERTLGSDARLSPLPPRFKLATVDRPPPSVQQDEEKSNAASRPALRLVREDSGEPLTAHETRFVAMAVLGRDPKVLRMPVKLLTLLIVRGLVAQQ